MKLGQRDWLKANHITHSNDVGEYEMATNSNTATETMAAAATGTKSGETANIAEMFA